MRINHNIAALNTYRQLSANTGATSKSLEKLSSGLRINRAGDDAAGLAISEKMRSQIRGLDQAARNANDGISLIQTAEGALNETHSILQRMKELAVQSSNDTNTTADRAEIQKEINQLTEEITRISKDTEFNTKKLLDGSMSVMGSAKTGGAGAGEITSVAAKGAMPVDGTYAIEVTGVTYASPATGGTAINIEDSDTTATVAASGSASPDIANGTYTITYNDSESEWQIGGDPIDPADYGLSVTGTAADGDTIEFTISGATPASGEKTVTYTVNGGAVDPDTFDISFSSDIDTGATFNVTVDNDKSSIFHIGANSGQNISLSINKMDAASLGVASLNLTTQAGADAAITTIDAAISQVSSERAMLGAMQNRLEHTVNNLGTTSENLSASESRIRDVDMAREMMEFTKNNILSQASQAMLAQANMQPQSVLQLLQ